MSTDPNGFMPPTPRDRDVPTLSEIIPFRSKKISIRRSKVLLPFMIVALTVVALFALLGNQQFDYFIELLASLLVAGIFLAIYAYSGSRKRWWWYIVPAVISYFLLTKEFWFYVLIFRKILPGNDAALDNISDFLPTFQIYFFAAGLCEESLKATPALLALVAGLLLNPRGRAPGAVGGRRSWGGRILRNLTLRGPLDGLLMSCAAGAAFIIDETLGQYVPNLIGKVMAQTHSDAVAHLYGLGLVIPRTLQGVSGHMAWAGIFGYFIGLSARYPKRAYTLLPLGYLVAATLHAFWDSAGTLPMPNVWYALDSVVTVFLFVGCLLKAKQLELAWYGTDTSNDSVLVGAPAPSSAGGALSGLQKLASGLEAAAGAPIAPEAAPIGRFSIGTGEDRYALDAGSAIDFGTLFGDRGAPAGALGEIDPHPTEPNALGLTNTGAAPWVSTTPTGATVSVPQGRSLPVAAGTRIAFGTLVLDIQTY